jgi:hypothetical protein
MRRMRFTSCAGSRLVRCVPLLVAVTFVLTGCTKMTGGGWIPSTVPGERATFGFTARCVTTTISGLPAAVLHDGEFEFEDHGAGVSIHGEVEPSPLQTFPGMTCKQLAESDPNLLKTGGFEGTYRTQGMEPSHDGTFVVVVHDGGRPGTIAGDRICVDLVGATAAFTYTNCDAEVQGGNIRVE